jgi:hypothetical protein
MIEPFRPNSSQRTATTSSHYTPLTTNERFILSLEILLSFFLFSQRYTLDNYPSSSSSRTSGVNLIRQDSYITAVRSAHQNEQADFGMISTYCLMFFNHNSLVNLHVCGQFAFSFNPETPILRRKGCA